MKKDHSYDLLNLINKSILIHCVEQCWRSDESTDLPAMLRGCDSRIGRHTWVEFVGSLPCSERFLSRVSPFIKNQRPTFEFI